MAWDGRGCGDRGDDGVARGVLAGFRRELFRCFPLRRDALFGLADAVLCAGGRVTDLARLSLVPEFGRGHGALYDALNAGRAEIGRLRRAVAGLPLPAWENGQIRLGVDVCCWLRPDAETSGERLFCPVHGRGKNSRQLIPGWPYSFVAALGPGRSSWTVLLDAVRLRPHDDETEVTAAQLREVVTRLIRAGHWKQGDPPVLIAMDSGYSGTRLAWLLRDLPVTVLVRVRSDRVFYRPAPDRAAGRRGRDGRHGDPVKCADPATWTGPDLEAGAESARHGPLAVLAFSRVHQMIHRGCGGWDAWPPHREYPLVEGTLIRLAVTAPARAGLDPMWLWASDPGAGTDPDAVAVLWQAYLRRFDLEHTFRFLKQQLGWDKAMLRDPAAADRWTWLIITCHAQLWLARDLAADIRLPWQRPQPRTATTQVMTPGRVRAGFRVVRHAAGTPASSGKYATPGPGRPPGSPNKRKAPRRHVGKTILTQHTIDEKNRKQAKTTRATGERAG
jgi:hypothetical protein